LIVGWCGRFLFFVVPRQFSQDISEWPEIQILIPDWTYFHCPGTTLALAVSKKKNYRRKIPTLAPPPQTSSSMPKKRQPMSSSSSSSSTREDPLYEKVKQIKEQKNQERKLKHRKYLDDF